MMKRKIASLMDQNELLHWKALDLFCFRLGNTKEEVQVSNGRYGPSSLELLFCFFAGENPWM
jgi:hypothetical protein